MCCASPAARLELVLVNDASPDDSTLVLQEIQSRHPEVMVLTHARNLGQQEAIRSGLRASGGNWIAVLDADLQDPPEQIPVLLQALRERRVHAAFALRDSSYQRGTRMLTSRLFKWLVRRMVGLPRGAGCFVIMDRPMRDAVLAFDTKRFYLPGLLCRTGLAWTGVPYRRARRTHGASSYTGSMRLATALSNIRCLLETR